MPQKKVNNTSRLENTLNELDSAFEQWNSLTNKPIQEQAPCGEPDLQQKAQGLLKQLREQLDELSK